VRNAATALHISPSFSCSASATPVVCRGAVAASRRTRTGEERAPSSTTQRCSRRQEEGRLAMAPGSRTSGSRYSRVSPASAPSRRSPSPAPAPHAGPRRRLSLPFRVWHCVCECVCVCVCVCLSIHVCMHA
jgi:hypothetical protein